MVFTAERKGMNKILAYVFEVMNVRVTTDKWKMSR